MQHDATEGDGMQPDYLLRESCRIARNRGFIAGLAVMVFVVATVLVVMAILR